MYYFAFGFFHSVCFWDLFMLSVSVACSFFESLGNIPLCDYTSVGFYFYLFAH